MMAPRDLISGSIFTNSTPTVDQTIHELQTELHHARNQIRDLQYELSVSRANVSRLQRNRNKPVIVPVGDCDDGYYCPHPHCNIELIEDYSYCPGCGCEIDWRGYVPSCDEDAYDRRFDR